MKREPRRRHVWMLPPAGTRRRLDGSLREVAGTIDGSPAHDDTTVLHNEGDHPAYCQITLYFEDREPAGPYRLRVDPRDSMRLHLRAGDLGISRCRGLLVSDVPVVLETPDSLSQAPD